MRDKNRIKLILGKLEKVWESQPDLRLAQLMLILAKTYGDYKQNDLFYLEDSDLEEGIEKFMKVRGIK